MKSARQSRGRSLFVSRALLAGSLGLLGLLVLGVAAPHAWWTRNSPLSFEADSAAGMSAGMDVRISGYPVGRVDQLRLLPNTRVLVTLSVAEDRLAIIGSGSRASIAQDSLISKPYIAIRAESPRRNGRPQPGSEPRLRFEPTANLMTLIEDVAESRLALQQMLNRTSRLVERRVPQTLDRLDRTLGSGETLANTLRREVVSGSAAVKEQAGSTVNQVELTLSSLQRTLVEIQSLARSSNSLLQGIRRSWLIELLEPADSERGPANPPAR